MTEKTAQEIIDMLTLNGRKPEHIKNDERVVYLSDAISIVRKSLTNDTPPFAVGEYYSSDDGKKIVKILGNIDNQTEYCVYDAQYGTFKKWYIPAKDMTAIFPDLTPATAERIATFKRAEQFAKHGRKLDEFAKNDLVKDSTGDLYVVYDMSNVFLYDIHGEVIGEKENTTLIRTIAEELQEVGE